MTGKEGSRRDRRQIDYHDPDDKGGISVDDWRLIENAIDMAIRLHIDRLGERMLSLEKALNKVAILENDIRSNQLVSLKNKESLDRMEDHANESSARLVRVENKVDKLESDIAMPVQDYKAWKANKKFIGVIFAALGALIATVLGLISVFDAVYNWIANIKPPPPG